MTIRNSSNPALKNARSFKLGGMKSKMKTNQDVSWDKIHPY